MTIYEMSVDTFWKGEVRIQAQVEDQGHTCRTLIYIKSSQMFDYSCSCEKGNSCKGACVHALALFEEYKKRAAAEKKIPVSTSAQIRTMIREYTNREVARMMGEEEPRQIRLVPLLKIGRSGISLEFRLGEKKLYFVKDLAAFCEAVQEGRRVEYGKGLAFEHSILAFEPESRPLVTFLMGEAGSFTAYQQSMQKTGQLLSGSFRSLPLSKASRDRFFEVVEDRIIEAEDSLGRARSFRAVRENPPFRISVRKVGEEGIRVFLPPDLLVFSGERHLYAAEGEKLYCCSEEYTDAVSVFLEQMISCGGRPVELTVNRRDIPLFYARVLDRFSSMGLLDAPEIDWEEYRPRKLKALFSFDCRGPGEVVMRPKLSYGDFSFHPLEDEKIPREICRDVPGEFRISRLITRYFPYQEEGTGNLVLKGDEDGLYRLLSEGMERFREAGEIWLSEDFKKLKVLSAPRISFGVSVGAGWLDLTIEPDGLSGAELLKILEEYRRKKKYFRMKSGEFLDLSGDGLLAVSKLADELALSKASLQEKTVRLPSYRALYLDQLLKENGRAAFRRDEAFASMIRELRRAADAEVRVPKEQETVLREYQRAGFSWLKTLDRYGFGGILADDMGLGKTLQILTLIESEREEERQKGESSYPISQSLVICPASLIYNWEHECRTFAPRLKVLPVTGPASERRERLERMEEYDVIITSYELLKRDFDLYREKEFRFEVIDEAQYIKNASTQSARTVKAIKAVSRFALTGTPVENRLSELWSIFDYLMPGFLFGYRKFKTMFEIPIVRDQDPERLALLRRMIGPFLLRRLKQDVLTELPPKLEKVVYSAAAGRQRELYQAAALKLKESLLNGEESGSARIEILAQLTRLRQICCDPSLCFENYSKGSAKLETCLQLISSAAAAGHKMLVFSQFASMLEIIKKRLEAEGIGCHMLIGATPKEERNRMVHAFSEDAVPVFLISLKAGGTGLNLTAADMVIHYDPWWNVAAQNQATDRTHRIGQDKQVTVYQLIMKDTIEENIRRLQASKKELADQVVTEGMVSLGSLSREELLEILGPCG